MSGPVVPADRPRRLARALLLGLAGGLLPSCTAPSPALPSPAITSAHATPTSAGRGQTRSARADDAAAQLTLDAVAHAIRTGNRDAFQRQFSRADPGGSLAAAQLYRLSELPLTSLSLRLGHVHRDLPRSRQALLGAGAFLRQVVLTWELSGDTGPARHVRWLTFSPQGGATQIVGTDDGPAERASQPLWLLEPLVVVQRGRTLVLAGPRRPYAAWIRAGNAAVAALRKRLHAGLGDRWNGRLVFELPGSKVAFEQVLGVAPGSYAQIAAVAWPEGPEPGGAAVRIVVNPELASRLDEQTRRVLVTHEATHVATRSAASAAPTWLVEGFADFLAYDAYPRTAGRAAAQLLAAVQAHGAPRHLPSNAAFSPGAADLDLTYAQSWLACRYLARTYSAAALDRFYGAVDSGVAVDEALRTVFGLSEREFAARWAADLESASRQRPSG